jgi:hypothetical protein
MTKIQVQLPDALYAEAKRVAGEREIALAEVIRRGVESIVRVYPPVPPEQTAWSPPDPRPLGAFRAPEADWRRLANVPTD